MSRNVSLLQLRTWARRLSDTVNDPFVTDAQLTDLANWHLAEVYDRLVDAGPPDYFAATTTATTISGRIQYPLQVDFRNLVGVYVQETSDERRPLMPMPGGARGNYKAPTGPWTVEIEYVPTAPTLSLDADTFDGVSGWEELIANLMAFDVMKSRESDPSAVMATITAIQARITSRSRNRDKGAAKRITDLDDAAPFPRGWGGNSRLSCYRLRGDNLELYEPLWGIP